jgi:hypothetical protein
VILPNFPLKNANILVATTPFGRRNGLSSPALILPDTFPCFLHPRAEAVSHARARGVK